MGLLELERMIVGGNLVAEVRGKETEKLFRRLLSKPSKEMVN